MTRISRLGALALLLSACNVDKSDTGGETPTWYQDVAPILEAKCAVCHEAGGIAPFPLETYAEAKPFAAAIAAATASGSMPPWPASDDCNTYQFDRSLSDEQIATLGAWSEAGAPEGDPSAPGPAISSEIAGLSRIDAQYTMTETYTPTIEPDEYRCFVYDWEEGATYVTGMGVTPSERQVVHHVIAFAIAPDDVAQVHAWDDAEDGPGYGCFGGPSAEGAERLEAEWLGGWVPGATGSDFPEGTGIPMAEGSALVVQIHYNTDTAGPLPDQSTVSFSLADSVETEARIAKILDTTWALADTLDIPAGDAAATDSYTLTVPVDITIYAAGLHMHTLGSSASLMVNDGSTDTCVLEIPDWDFHWQGSYTLAEPMHVARGAEITVSCTWDNSEGSSDVGWGEGSSDEMCLGSAYVTVD